jgi:hypothetical protein
VVGESLHMRDRRLVAAGTESMGLATPNILSVLEGILCTYICIVNLLTIFPPFLAISAAAHGVYY